MAAGWGLWAAAAPPPVDHGRSPAPAGRSQLEPGHPSANRSFSTIGSERCRACHRQLYLTWQTTGHAAAGDRLDVDQPAESRCRACHQPDPNAFDAGVGCEACHGAGSAYAELDVMIDPLKRGAAGLREPRESCPSCHNPTHSFHVERDLSAEAVLIHSARR